MFDLAIIAGKRAKNCIYTYANVGQVKCHMELLFAYSKAKKPLTLVNDQTYLLAFWCQHFPRISLFHAKYILW